MEYHLGIITMSMRMMNDKASHYFLAPPFVIIDDNRTSTSRLIFSLSHTKSDRLETTASGERATHNLSPLLHRPLRWRHIFLLLENSNEDTTLVAAFPVSASVMDTRHLLRG